MTSPIQFAGPSHHLLQGMQAAAAPLRLPPSLSNAEKVAYLRQVLDSIPPPQLHLYLPHPPSDNVHADRAQAVDTFKNSNEFKALRDNTVRALVQLHKLVEPNQNFEQSRWALLRDRLGLNGKATAKKPIKDGLYELYNDTCTSLQRLGAIAEYMQIPGMPFSNTQKNSIVAKAKDLAGEFDMCGPGIVSKTHSTLIRATHELFPVSMGARFNETRSIVAKAVIQKWANKHLSHFEHFAVNEIHIVNAWYRHMSHSYQLMPQPDDFHAVDCYITDTSAAACQYLTEQLNSGLHPISIALHLGEELLEEIQENCDVSQSDWFATVSKNLTEMTGRWGQVDCREVIEFDEYLFPKGLLKNPTLLALNFLEQAYGFRPEENISAMHHNTPSSPEDGILSDNSCQASVYSMNELVWICRADNTQHKPYTRELVSFETIRKGEMTHFLGTPEEPHRNRLGAFQLLHECFRNADYPQTRVFKEKPWNANEYAFFSSALRMTQQLLPDDIKPGCPPNQFLANVPFVAHLTEGSLDDYYSDADFDTVANSLNWALTTQESIQPGANLANVVFESEANGHKLFCALIKKLHMHPAYEPNIALQAALKSNNPKKLDAVMEYWPEGVPLDTTLVTGTEPLLTRAIKLNPQAETFKKLIALCSDYPAAPSKPKPSPMTQFAKLRGKAPAEDKNKIQDPLYNACMRMRPDLVEAMINSKCLPKVHAECHETLLTDTVCKKNANEATAKAALKAMNAMGLKPKKNDVGVLIRECRRVQAHSTLAEFLNQTGALNGLDYWGYAELHDAVRQNDMAYATALLQAGANVNVRASARHMGKTPLHMAYRSGNSQMIHLLKQNGADETLRDLKMRLPASLENRLPEQNTTQLRR